MAVTFATLMDEYSQMVEVIDRDYKQGSGAGNTANSFVANLTALDAVTEDSPEKAGQISAMRNAREVRANALVSPWIPWFSEWCTKFARLINAPASGLAAIPWIWEYFHDNSQAVARRNFTRGSVSWSTSANSLSTSLVVSTSVDWEGYNIEDGPRYDTNDSDIVHEWRCDADPQTGNALGQFIWTLAGYPAVDSLDDPDSFIRGLRMQVVDGGPETGNILQNGLFQTYTAGNGKSKFEGWYIDAQESSVTQDTASANGFRPKLNTITESNTTGDFATMSLAYNGTAQPKVYQYIDSPLSPIFPYMIGVTFKGEDGTADGNLTLTAGAASHSASVTTSWQHIFIHQGTAKNAWYKNFANDPLEVSVQRTGSPTAGNVLVHAVYFYPFFSYFAGRYVNIIAGSDEYRRDDLATATDSVANTSPAGTNQYWWNRLCRIAAVPQRFWYLPSAASATTNAHDYS